MVSSVSRASEYASAHCRDIRDFVCSNVDPDRLGMNPSSHPLRVFQYKHVDVLLTLGADSARAG